MVSRALGTVSLIIWGSILITLLGCNSSPSGPGVSAVKLLISEPGIYRVTSADIQKAGLRVQDLQKLALEHHAVPVPLEVEVNGQEWSAIFYAEPERRFSPTDAYWLREVSEAPLRMQARVVQAQSSQAPSQSFRSTVKLEQNLLYSPEAIGDSHWFWQSLTAPTNKKIEVSLPELNAAAGELRLRVAGVTPGAHRLQVVVNGESVGGAQWDGVAGFTFQASVSNLRAGTNQVELRAPKPSGGVDVSFMDALEIEYQRAFVAEDVLEFEGGPAFQVMFHAEPVLLFDISDRLVPQRLTGFATDATEGLVELKFQDSQSGRRYLAVATRALKKPTAVLPTHAQTPGLDAPDLGADYLIIAPSSFFDALQPLVKYRTSRGLRVGLVSTEQVFDQFGDGEPDPQALQDFMGLVRSRWKPVPRFLLLVGKASYDQQNYLKGPNENLLPTHLTPTLHLGEAANDDWFIRASQADPRPALAVGRIPAETPKQLSTAINKVIAYEKEPSSGWRKRAVFVADDKEESFEKSSNELVARLAPTLEAEQVYLSHYKGDLGKARGELVSKWNEGALLMTYIGHGSIDTWAAGPLLSVKDIAALNNRDRLPILLTPTCLDGFFYHPQKDSLTEQLLFKDSGGIVAGLVPTGLSLPSSQDLLMNALFQELFVKRTLTLGEAILRAKLQVNPDSPETREVLETFMLIGDPALVWQVPP